MNRLNKPAYLTHPKKLHVVAVISNPLRWYSRYELYEKFRRHMEESGCVLITVEIAFGDRPFAITDAANPHHVQLRTFDEIWHKENMINIGFQRVVSLYPDAEYLAWIDADVEFARKDWVNETLHQLQHYMFVQMFQQAVDLGPRGEAFQTHQGFMFSYLEGRPRPKKGYPYAHWHPGYCWAARREALDFVGGLYDVSILGSGDHLMAWAMVGEGLKQLPDSMSPGYKRSLALWEENCTRHIKRDVGFVNGTILHHWHGKKADRNYKGRWQILEEHQFCPERHLKRDLQGLWQFNIDDSLSTIRLRDEMRRYYRLRNEDSTDMV